MSGGHFDYDCFKCSEFAFKVKKSLEDVENGTYTYLELNEESRVKLHCLIDIMEGLDPMLKEIEWLWSGDTSDKLFLENINPHLNILINKIIPGCKYKLEQLK